MNEFASTASWDHLVRRATMLERVRHFFAVHGFLEVETPLLSQDTVVDRYIDPLRAEGRFLQTSPEFAMKRLLASGMDRSEAMRKAGFRGLWQCCKAFRQDESGTLHNPEFTVIEWYHLDHDFESGINFLSDFSELLFNRGPAKRITYAAAFEAEFGMDPYRVTALRLRKIADENHIAYPEDYAKKITDEKILDSAEIRDLWLDLLLSERIQPKLGSQQPTILTEYPASQAALAQTRNDAHGRLVAERFELYLDGVELANGYHELLDPAILRDRNRENNRIRRGESRMELPEESGLLAAMESGLPASTGCALGFDRAVMLALKASRLADVIAFPWERA
ncbi:MAG: EF-P lysine aminoacylase EpmA [Thermoguttaceae bacterium]|nr:EF-P lysine aminoacylase EpmA [Thermoguttaceae bacterium]